MTHVKNMMGNDKPQCIHIGERIRRVRKRASMTQAELAKEIGVSTSTISKYERGKVIPTSLTLHVIARITGVRVAYFFKEDIKLESVHYIQYDEGRCYKLPEVLKCIR